MSYHWRKERTPVSHTDDWLMTYADLITLLLCFFAIVIITSVPKKNMQPKAPIQQELPHPEQIAVLPPQLKAETPPPALPSVFSGDLPFHSIGPEDVAADPPPAPQPTQTEPTPDTSIVAEQAAAPPATNAAPQQQPPVPTEKIGDRITTFEINSAAFFDSGSALLSKSGALILQKVAVRLQSDEFKDYEITVEGHTDDTPIHTLQFPSNWELSTARASAVVHYFLEHNIPAIKLRAAGYADTFPKAPNRDSNGRTIPANQVENRRVVIKLEKIEKN
jgi:flagellar motor protein MotB